MVYCIMLICLQSCFHFHFIYNKSMNQDFRSLFDKYLEQLTEEQQEQLYMLMTYYMNKEAHEFPVEKIEDILEQSELA